MNSSHLINKRLQLKKGWFFSGSYNFLRLNFQQEYGVAPPKYLPAARIDSLTGISCAQSFFLKFSSDNFYSTGMSSQWFGDPFWCLVINQRNMLKEWVAVPTGDWRFLSVLSMGIMHPTGDESKSKWNGLGGTGINKGLTIFVDTDRKPVKSFEIQNRGCGRSGIMLWFCLKKPQENNENLQKDDELSNGTNILLDLLHLWHNTHRATTVFSNHIVLDLMTFSRGFTFFFKLAASLLEWV